MRNWCACRFADDMRPNTRKKPAPNMPMPTHRNVRATSSMAFDASVVLGALRPLMRSPNRSEKAGSVPPTPTAPMAPKRMSK